MNYSDYRNTKNINDKKAIQKLLKEWYKENGIKIKYTI